MNDFCEYIIFSSNMRDRYTNVVLDTSIRYNKYSIRIIREILVNVFEFVEINSLSELKIINSIYFYFIRLRVRV